MANVVRLSKKLVSSARIVSEITNRSISAQIKHWVIIGKIVEENPTLTYEFIRNILNARLEVDPPSNYELLNLKL
ncbi:MAG: hypothetical protein A3F16_04770 [Deltaproteobacteria bacterium RIFCSPHIGHO2_12_FULL_43_9]|nr:MAG: hypothetical protein A3F16_04770 [Deltaproteobacteria bacterium RIFCSPHIGHO2_12_FULL_43_9]